MHQYNNSCEYKLNIHRMNKKGYMSYTFLNALFRQLQVFEIKESKPRDLYCKVHKLEYQ